MMGCEIYWCVVKDFGDLALGVSIPPPTKRLFLFSPSRFYLKLGRGLTMRPVVVSDCHNGQQILIYRSKRHAQKESTLFETVCNYRDIPE